MCNEHACYLTRKDKYNKKINKYYVEYEEEDEQVLSDEEKERHEDGEEASQLKRLDHFHCALCTRYIFASAGLLLLKGSKPCSLCGVPS